MYKNIIVGIYKIENLINHKIYIGQSKHIYSRWCQHRHDGRHGDTPLYRAFKKYGIENFSFEVLETCKIDEFTEKELFYINYYNSLVPHGYNVVPPKENWTTNNIPLKIKEIKEVLLTTKKTYQKIGEEFGLSSIQIARINRGLAWRIEGEKYPLRKKYYTYEANKVISLLQKGLSIKEVAKELNASESSILWFMETHGIKTTDFHKRRTSNKKIFQYDLQSKLVSQYDSIKDAAIKLYEDEAEIQLNSLLCGIKRNLNKKPYKGYFWKTFSYDENKIDTEEG